MTAGSPISGRCVKHLLNSLVMCRPTRRLTSYSVIRVTRVGNLLTLTLQNRLMLIVIRLVMWASIEVRAVQRWCSILSLSRCSLWQVTMRKPL